MVSVSLIYSHQEMWIEGLRLHNLVIGSARLAAPSLRNFPAMLSNPVAFEGLISSKSFRTVSREVGNSSNGSEMLRY